MPDDPSEEAMDAAVQLEEGASLREVAVALDAFAAEWRSAFEALTVESDTRAEALAMAYQEVARLQADNENLSAQLARQLRTVWHHQV